MVLSRANVNNFLYAPVSPSLINNINQVNGFDYTLLNDNFRNYVQDMNNYINSDEYMQTCMMLAAYRDDNPIDVLIYLATPDNWVLGKRMREMLMASPNIESLTMKGFLEGCSTIENSIVNYGSAVNGFVVEEDGEYICKKWYGDDEPFDMYEQLDILETWENANDMISNGIDPTSFED